MSLAKFFFDPSEDFNLPNHAPMNTLVKHNSGSSGGSNSGNKAARNHGRSTPTGVGRVVKPRLDVYEDTFDNLVYATFELPGLSRDDMNIDVHNGLLIVSGEFKALPGQIESAFTIRERRYGKFCRSHPLPLGVKAEDVSASLENGILSVTYPKVTPEQAPKRIIIH